MKLQRKTRRKSKRTSRKKRSNQKNKNKKQPEIEHLRKEDNKIKIMKSIGEDRRRVNCMAIMKK